MKRSLLLMLVIVLLVLCSQSAQAAVFKTSNTITIDSNQVINDDLYISGGTVVINGTINGDLIVAGGNVTVNGKIRDDLMATGGSIALNGSVGQSIRASGGSLSLAGTVGDDLLVAGGSVNVSSKSTIARDALLAAGSTRLSGRIGRKLYGAGGDITIDGPVGGSARLDVTTLRLTDKASIGGDLFYRSENKAEIARGATIKGKITHQVRPRPQQRAGSRVLTFILAYLAAFLFGLVLLLLFPAKTALIADTILTSPWLSLLLGFVLLIVVPIAALILLVFIITIPLSLTALLLYALGIYLAKVFVGLAVGLLIARYFKLNIGNILALALGLFLIMLVGAIPFIGPFIRFLYIIFGLGVAAYVLFRNVGRRATPQA